MLMSEATDAEITEALNSVFSTNLHFLHLYVPGRVHRSHQSFKNRDEYRFFFSELMKQVLFKKKTGEAAYIICGYIQNAAKKINVDVLEAHSMPPHLAKERSHLALVK